MTPLELVRQKSAEYDNQLKRQHSTSEQLSDRFKALVHKHGVSFVAAATGLRESTISQYARCKSVPVSEAQVIKAEVVLNSL